MVYMYYGFFLFLLYMTAPLWVFLPVAVVSWWALRSSFNFQKVIKTPISNFGMRGQHAVELEERLKTSWPKSGKERRRFKRFLSSLNVSYQVLGDEWKKEKTDHPFDGSIVYPEPQPSNVQHALTWDVSQGGLSIMGEQPLTTGQPLKLFLQLPQQQAPTTLLAEVRKSRASHKWGKTRYHTGLKFLALDQQDLEQLTDYLCDESPQKRAS